MPLRPQQVKPFFFAATKIRIGRVIRCRYGRCRRNDSSLRQQKLESDAEQRRLNDGSRRNHSSLPLRKVEADGEDRCRYEISRRNHSPLHRFASLGLKSRITAVPSCRQVEWPACSSRSRIDAVSDSNFRCLKEEWPACSSFCRNDAVSDSNFRRLKEEWPACSSRSRIDAVSDSNFRCFKEE